MATDLYIISNIGLTKEEVLSQKDEIIQKLKDLNYQNFLYPKYNSETGNEEWIKSEGDWEYELPHYWDDKTKSYLPGTDCKEVLYFNGSKSYSITAYEECLVLSSISRYGTLYKYESDFFPVDMSDYYYLRKEIKLLIEIFGGTEVIFVADNACDKLHDYLIMAQEKVKSYEFIKNKMLVDGTPIERNYLKLDSNKLDYGNITEYVMDDFSNLEDHIPEE